MEAISSLDQADQRIPQDADVYVNYYGLTGDPFNPEKPLFFTTPHLEKLHRLFNYLSRFSRKLVVVTGAPGAGKTALLEHFVQDQSEEDLVCYFAALKTDTPEQVLQEIADQLEMDNFGSGLSVNDLTGAIQTFSLARLDEGCSCIVVIDDAHLFEVAVLKQLYLLTLDDSQARCSIRLLLCGEEQLLERLREVVPVQAAERTVFHQQISPLTFEETRQYLHVHFRENGGQNKPPFNDSEYQRIYDVSKGLPGRINEAAKQLMVEAVNRLVDSGPDRKPPRIFFWVLVPALLIVSAIFWWQSSNSEQELAPLADGELTGQIERGGVDVGVELGVDEIFAQSEPEQLEKPLTIETESAQVENTAKVEEATEPLESSSADDFSEISDAEVIVAGSPALDEIDGLELPERVAKSDLAIAEETPADLPEGAELAAVVDAAAPLNESLLMSHSRQILAFNKSGYTMQLLGSRNVDSILTTMNKRPNDKNLLYFEKTHKGAPWYVLIYGNYPDKEAADRAAANLPKALGNLKPWVRSIAGIQKEVIMPSE